MEELMELLKDTVPDIDFAKEKYLVSNRVIDSFMLLSIASAISDEYNIELDPDDFIAENFDSVDSIFTMIQRHKDL